MTLDDLELELRKLAGVKSIGFTERDDVLLVQLHVGPEHVEPGLAIQATRIACRHSERSVAVELVRWRTVEAPVPASKTTSGNGNGRIPPAPAPEPAPAASEEVRIDLEPETVVVNNAELRVRLLAVLTFPDTDELEVHVTLHGRRTIGRAAASRGLLGAVEATLDGIRTFAHDLSYLPGWARTLETNPGEPFLVAVGLLGPEQEETRHGLASGSSPIEAAARATLHAVNRTVAPQLEPAS